MRNEDEQNMNVLRGIIGACEEGANDELSDGSDGAEPWTEEDRRASRATAEWLRATFLSPPAPQPRSKPKGRRGNGVPLFSDDQLWNELDRVEPDRRSAAVDAIDALANLASVRARKRNTSFLMERHSVFDMGLIDADVQSGDRELEDAAFRVLDDVCHLRGLVEAHEGVSTPEDDVWAKKVRASVLAKVEELRRAADERENGGGS